MSPYAPFPFSDWGGIDLRSEADQANGAIDVLNCDLDREGAVRTRDGYTHLNGTANPVSFSSGPLVPGGTYGPFLSGSDDKIYAYDTAGTLQGTSGAYVGDSIVSAVRFGTGTNTYTYFGFRFGAANVRMTTAFVFSSPGGMPSGKYLAIQSPDNRLVAAGTATNPSRAWFSDPNDAETFGANSYADLHPNDGQTINGVVSWQNLTFIFKDRKFFVFYGNTEDGSGNALFNRRAIDTGVGLYLGGSGARLPACVATPDGVYFIAHDGIYRTTGGSPTLISDPLQPLFKGLPTPYGTITAPLDPISATYVNGRVCFLVEDGNTHVRYILVYDPPSGQWLPWQTGVTPIQGLAAIVSSSSNTTMRLCFASGTRVYTQSTSDTTDDGAGITGRYRSPYVNLNYIRRQRKWLPISSQESTVRETILDGTGTVGYSLARDWATSLPTTGGGRKGIVKLGASTVGQGRHRYAQRGRAMSFQLETPTASDSFGSNTIANYTADLGATTNVSITGGVMAAAANLTTVNYLVLTSGTFTDFGDSVITMKVTLGTTRTGFFAGMISKRVSAGTLLNTVLTDSGSQSLLQIYKNVAGTPTLLSSTVLSRISASTSYWIRRRIEGNVITAEFFTADPASNVAATTATYTLTGSDATTFGAGVVGKTGILFLPQQAAASVDDFSVVGGAWKVEDLVWHLTGVRQSGVETT